MILRYRVSLPNIKGFARVYDLQDNTTLYEFNKRMRNDMSLSHDQLALFKAYDESNAIVARYGMFDLGEGTVDSVTVGMARMAGIDHFTYYYDIPNKKSVEIYFEDEVDFDPAMEYPALVFSKGPDPIEFEHGYVAYEDLPEDQKHHPGESVKAQGRDLEALLDDDDLDVDIDDDDDDDDDDGDDDGFSEGGGSVVYDGSEDLNF